MGGGGRKAEECGLGDHYLKSHCCFYAGSEAMFADLGHFNKSSIQVKFMKNLLDLQGRFIALYPS